MKALIFDTETTGKWDFNAPYTAAHQPNLVQLAVFLEDVDPGAVQAEASLIVAQEEGQVIPAGAQAVHGISTDKANDFGIHLANASFLFRNLVERADVVVAHNISFDVKIMTRALWLAGVEELPWSKIPQRCTMLASTPICKVPSPKGRGFKWPSLAEAMRYFYGEEIANAHTAKADADACRLIHRALIQRGAFPR